MAGGKRIKKPKPKEHKPIFSEGEVIFLFVYTGALDIGDLFSFGMPASDFFSWMAQAYEWKKGTSGTLQLIIAALEIVPGIDYLPIRSIALLLFVWGDTHPDSKLAKFIKTAETISAIKKGGKGGGAPGGKAALKEAGGGAGSAVDAVGKNAPQTTRGPAGEVQSTATPGGDSVQAGGAKAGGKEAGTGSVRDRDRQRGGERQESGEGAPGDATEDSETKTPEEIHNENLIRGRHLDELQRNLLGPEEILDNIGKPQAGAKVLKFDPTRMGPEMKPKPRQGIINSSQVDLRNPDKKNDERKAA